MPQKRRPSHRHPSSTGCDSKLSERLTKLRNDTDGVCDIEEYLHPSPIETLPVTFDRSTWDESDDASLIFLTYGTPELAALLPAPDVAD